MKVKLWLNWSKNAKYKNTQKRVNRRKQRVLIFYMLLFKLQFFVTLLISTEKFPTLKQSNIQFIIYILNCIIQLYNKNNYTGIPRFASIFLREFLRKKPM